ncbi:sugar phosphate isomerase/epimerase [Mucilaginibacter sp. RS28]|uniref:Sugar phosphate isomerase/epimerase n=1 Tax=Mucilaginibacter straminoryzae TaxID=2932774 RepID=A0A9X1XBS0_9SPHI|nr:sugar phosphate isomerase/epimerase [Mucilaginibacter straminoryzae]MCJ8211864.1 sugar phosphate isomerase/epimerase [Mucilaginibacter straminoryzae]
MKRLLTLMLLLPLLSFAQKGLPAMPGMVSFTYRNYFAKDIPATLDIVKKNGVTDMEFSNLFGSSAEALRTQLDAHGIHCSSFGVSYDDLVNKTDEVARNAKALGAAYVRVAGIPHQGALTLIDAQKAVETFNKYGKILKNQYGLTFIYHNHGFEFEPYENGTLYDYLVQHTDPKYVSFELDILWAFLPGQNPAELLKRYGKRYKALHLKDLKKGVATGDLSGKTSQDNDVILGTGQIDIPSVLKAAAKAGVKHYYIEDESSAALQQVPESIKYYQSIAKQ